VGTHERGRSNGSLQSIQPVDIFNYTNGVPAFKFKVGKFKVGRGNP